VLASVTFSDQLAAVNNNTFQFRPDTLVNLCLVGQTNSAGEAVNGIVSSCNKLNAVEYKMPALTSFTFSIGDSILAKVTGAALLTYINAVLSIPLASVPFVAGLPAPQRVFDLGTAISTPAGLTHVDDGLFGIIKISSVSLTWNGSAWV
jgi:hypothetical protein